MSAFVIFLLILLGFIIGGLFTSWKFKDDDDTTVRSWEKWNEDGYREKYSKKLDENIDLLFENKRLKEEISQLKKELNEKKDKTINEKRAEYALPPISFLKDILENEDNVNHPNHYQGDIETIDYIKDKLTDEEFRGFVKGNVLKYVSREGLKNGDEDLKKSDWYLNKLIEVLE